MQAIDKLTEKDLLLAKRELEKIAAKQQELRDKEFAIREYLANVYHLEEEGTKTFTEGDVKFTIDRPVRRTITKADAEKLSQDHPEESLEILTWKPEVKVSGYRDNQKIADEYITTRPGPPTVKFK